MGQDTFERLQQLDRELTLDEEVVSISERIMDVFVSVPDDAMYDEMLTKVVLPVMESKHGVFGYIDNNDDLVCPSMIGETWDKCTMEGKSIILLREKWGGIWKEALNNKKMVFVNSGLNPPEGHFPVTRAVCGAIIYGGKLLGLLLVANRDSDYTQADADTLKRISRIIAPVLHLRLQQDRLDKELSDIKRQIVRGNSGCA